LAAQILDYGSWVRRPSAERLAHIVSGRFARESTIDVAFADRFGHSWPLMRGKALTLHRSRPDATGLVPSRR
jgi:hypothetical protein